jgi:hypothetical protein
MTSELASKRSKSTFVLLAVILVVASRARTKPIDKRIESALATRPQPLRLQIQWEDVEGLSEALTWKVNGTEWWVQLHPKEMYREERLDRGVAYELVGAVMEQGYGWLHVWVYELNPIPHTSPEP